MTDWTNDQSDQITSLYGKLKDKYKKEADQKLFGGPQLPYLEAFNTLTSLIKQQEKNSGGLEEKITGASEGIFAPYFKGFGKFFSKPVAVGATALLLLYLGLPPVY